MKYELANVPLLNRNRPITGYIDNLQNFQLTLEVLIIDNLFVLLLPMANKLLALLFLREFLH